MSVLESQIITNTLLKSKIEYLEQLISSINKEKIEIDIKNEELKDIIKLMLETQENIINEYEKNNDNIITEMIHIDTKTNREKKTYQDIIMYFKKNFNKELTISSSIC